MYDEVVWSDRRCGVILTLLLWLVLTCRCWATYCIIWQYKMFSIQMCVYEYLPKVNTADADAIDACNEYHASTHDRDQTCYTANVTLTAETSLQWRANERDGVPNHRRLYFLHDRLFRRILKKTSKFCVTGLCEEDPPVTEGFPPVTREMFPFDDVTVLQRKHYVLTYKTPQGLTCFDKVSLKCH